MKKLFIYIFLLVLISTSAFAEKIKWTKCKIIEDPILNSFVKVIQDEEFFKKMNDEEKSEYIEKIRQGKTILHEISFDFEKNLVSVDKQEKDEEIKKREDKFNIVNDTIVKVVGKERVLELPGKSTIKDPTTGKEIVLHDKKKQRVINIITYDFSDITATNHMYNGNFKELVVKVQCESNFKGISDDVAGTSGTAFFINKKGNLLTNNHVVEGCKLSKINYFNKEYDANLIATDNMLDLALLEVELKPKAFISFSKDELKKRDLIIIAGYPLGKYLSDDLKINEGKISSLKGFDNNSNEITVDLAINLGNSGGPIVNENGQLVAVAVSGMSKEVTEGISFGIKYSAVENFLKSNKISPNFGLTSFSMNKDKVNKLLEESTVYIFCE
jgi:S1-C subfamily serine protease